MKFVSLEITAKKISAQLLDTAKGAEGTVPISSTLPRDVGDEVFFSPEQLARFAALFLRENNLRKYPVSVMLELEQVVSAAFPHAPAADDKLRGLAMLFAETSLPNALQTYYIAHSKRTYLHPDGQHRSMLYAAPAEHVRRLFSALRKAGINATSVEASGAAFSRSVLGDTAHTTEPGKGDIYIDFGEGSALVAVRSGEQIVFEQQFSSVFQDMQDAYTDITGGGWDAAAEYFSTKGLEEPREAHDRFPDLARRLSSLADIMLDEIFRTLRISFSVARLDVGALYISGEMLKIRGFAEKVLADHGGFAEEGRAGIVESTRLNGAQIPKRQYSENLLHSLYSRQRRTTITALIAILILLALAMVFPLQYMEYQRDVDALEQHKKALEDEPFVEANALLARKRSLENVKTQLENSFKALPVEHFSRAGEITKKLYDTALPFANSLSFNLDNLTGILEVSFSAENFGDYLALKVAVEEDAFFLIAVPFSVSFNADSSCYGDFALSVMEFEEFVPAKAEKSPQSITSEGGENE